VEDEEKQASKLSEKIVYIEGSGDPQNAVPHVPGVPCLFVGQIYGAI